VGEVATSKFSMAVVVIHEGSDEGLPTVVVTASSSTHALHPVPS
jgi:hypothetical protein